MARDPSRNAPYAHALYAAVIAGPHRSADVARKLNVSLRTLQAWAENTASLPAWAVPLLYDATRDIALYGRLAGADDANRGVVLSAIDAGGAQGAEAVSLTGLRLGAAVGEVHGVVAAALADNHITAAEAAAAHEAIAKLQRVADTLGRQVDAAKFRVVEAQ